MRDRLRAWLWNWLGVDRILHAWVVSIRDEHLAAKLAMRHEFKGELNALAAEVAKQKPRLAPVDHAEFTDPHLGRL